MKRDDIDYYALEYTPSGDQLALMIKNEYSIENVHTGLFDFNDPVLPFDIKKKYKHVVMFSRHSIEQVSILKPDFHNKILGLPFDYDFIHQEPIGWQINEEEKERLGQSDRTLSEFKKQKYNHHNKNLYELLKLLESEKKIEILDINIDYSSFRMEWNASTMIKWKKVNI